MQKDNTDNRKLFILTTHFGINFSGGSTATHEIFVNMQDRFDEITILCTAIGDHSFSNVNFIIYKHVLEAFRILKSIPVRNTTFYGDFYNSILYVWSGKPFYFTYHDNWPEMSRASFQDFLRSMFYRPVYHSIFRHSKSVIVVSEYKKKYVSSFTKDLQLIRNGFNKKFTKGNNYPDPVHRILMVGNIDRRKYKMALRLFRNLKFDFPAEIHIYGNTLDKDLTRKLNSFDFVKIMGFRKVIAYQDYQCMLHTALIENLPIAICESLYFEIPVIAFDVGGIHEIVNETNGLLIPPFDINKMSEYLLKVLNHEIDFSFEDNVLTEFDWETASNKYLNILGLC
jgi:glycosyltransferase involved in cell wall biosynthesis